MTPSPSSSMDGNGAASFAAAAASSQNPVGYNPVGYLTNLLPSYVKDPPIETVLFAWGINEDGQLGIEAAQQHVGVPKVVEAMLGIRFAGRAFGQTPIVAGSRNTLAIDGEGRVWSWGWNDRGTLGHGHQGQEAKPKRIAALKGIRMKQVAVNGWHCLALDHQGQMYAWGGNEYLQCAVDPDKRDILMPMPCVPQLKVTMVACGGMHSLALTETGEVWTWGEPWGDFSLKVERQPRPVPGAAGMAAIAAGAFHNMALSRSGQVYTWGTNDYGQLGNGNTSYQIEPKPVIGVAMDNVTISDIAAGGWHSVALSSRGELFIWGRGEYGRLGLGDPTGSSKLRAKRVTALEGHTVVQVSAGGTHTMALTLEGRVFIWGRASFGRLGAGVEKDQYSPVECQLPGGPGRWKVISVACGGRHSLALALPVRQDPCEDEEQAEGLAPALPAPASTPPPRVDSGPKLAKQAVRSPGLGSHSPARSPGSLTQAPPSTESSGAGSTFTFGAPISPLGGLEPPSPAMSNSPSFTVLGGGIGAVADRGSGSGAGSASGSVSGAAGTVGVQPPQIPPAQIQIPAVTGLTLGSIQGSGALHGVPHALSVGSGSNSGGMGSARGSNSGVLAARESSGGGGSVIQVLSLGGAAGGVPEIPASSLALLPESPAAVTATANPLFAVGDAQGQGAATGQAQTLGQVQGQGGVPQHIANALSSNGSRPSSPSPLGPGPAPGAPGTGAGAGAGGASRQWGAANSGLLTGIPTVTSRSAMGQPAPAYTLSSELTDEIGGLNQEPDSDCDDEEEQDRQEEHDADSRRLGGMSDGGDADVEGEGERERERERRREMEEGQVVNVSGESDAPVDVQDLQGDSDDEFMIQSHHTLAMAMQRPKSPALGGMGAMNPSAMSPRHMSSMARHLGGPPTSPRHLSPRNMSPRNASPGNISPATSFGGGQ